MNILGKRGPIDGESFGGGDITDVGELNTNIGVVDDFIHLLPSTNGAVTIPTAGVNLFAEADQHAYTYRNTKKRRLAEMTPSGALEMDALGATPAAADIDTLAVYANTSDTLSYINSAGTVSNILTDNVLDPLIAAKMDKVAENNLDMNNFDINNATVVKTAEIHNKDGNSASVMILDEQKMSLGSDTLSLNGGYVLELNAPLITANGEEIPQTLISLKGKTQYLGTSGTTTNVAAGLYVSGDVNSGGNFSSSVPPASDDHMTNRAYVTQQTDLLQLNIDQNESDITTLTSDKMDKLAQSNQDMNGYDITNANDVSVSGTLTVNGEDITASTGDASARTKWITVPDELQTQTQVEGDVLLASGGDLIPLDPFTSDVGRLTNKFGNAYFSGVIDSNGLITNGGPVQTGAVYPDLTNARDLGNNLKLYRDLHLSRNAHCGSVMAGNVYTDVIGDAEEANRVTFDLDNITMTAPGTVSANGVELPTNVSNLLDKTNNITRPLAGQTHVSGSLHTQTIRATAGGSGVITLTPDGIYLNHFGGEILAEGVEIPDNITSLLDRTTNLTSTKLITNEVESINGDSNVLLGSNLELISLGGAIFANGIEVDQNINWLLGKTQNQSATLTNTTFSTDVVVDTKVVSNEIASTDNTMGITMSTEQAGGEVTIVDETFQTATLGYGGQALTDPRWTYGISPIRWLSPGNFQITNEADINQENVLYYNDPSIMSAINNANEWFFSTSLVITDPAPQEGQGQGIGLIYHGDPLYGGTGALNSTNRYCVIVRTANATLNIWKNGNIAVLTPPWGGTLALNQTHTIEIRFIHDVGGNTTTIRTTVNGTPYDWVDSYQGPFSRAGVGCIGYCTSTLQFAANYNINYLQLKTVGTASESSLNVDSSKIRLTSADINLGNGVIGDVTTNRLLPAVPSSTMIGSVSNRFNYAYLNNLNVTSNASGVNSSFDNYYGSNLGSQNLNFTNAYLNNIYAQTMNLIQPSGGVWSQNIGERNFQSTAPFQTWPVITAGAGTGLLTFPANYFKSGECYRISVAGRLTHGNGSTVLWNLRLNAFQIFSSGAISLKGVTAAPFEMEINFNFHGIGAFAVVSSDAKFTYKDNGTVETTLYNPFAGTCDTTIPLTLSLLTQLNTTGNEMAVTRAVVCKVY